MFLILLFVLLTTFPASPRAEECFSKGICGTSRIRDRSPDPPPKPLSLPSSKPISLGKSEMFKAYNFLTFERYDIETTLRIVGDNCYVFVEDSQWQLNVTQEDVELMAHIFDESTDADPGKGVFQIETSAFGDPPDVDADPRIYIVLLDIQDGHVPGTSTNFVAGYFDFNNQVPSRGREIVYLDSNPLDLEGRLAKATLAHEFQHLIHWAHDIDEDDWINEGLSGYAEDICGYADERYGALFPANPNNSLTFFSLPIATEADYDKTFLFVSYFAEHYGGLPTVRELVDTKENGILGIDRTLQKLALAAQFKDVFSDWTVANYLDDNGKYGYSGLDIDKPETSLENLLPVETSSGRVQGWAAQYIEFVTGENLKITFTGEGFTPRLILRRNGKAQILDFPASDEDLNSTLEAIEADTVTLVVAKTSDFGGNYRYSAQASTISLVQEEETDFGLLPSNWELEGNFPNPFNPTTFITFLVPPEGDGAQVELDIYNSSGQRITSLVNEIIRAGSYRLNWDGRDKNGDPVSSGVYFALLRTSQSGVFQKKMTLLK